MIENNSVWINKLNRLKQLHNWTNDTLASSLGITSRTLSDFIKMDGGRNPPRPIQLLIDRLLLDSETETVTSETASSSIPVFQPNEEHVFIVKSTSFFQNKIAKLTDTVNDIRLPNKDRDIIYQVNELFHKAGFLSNTAIFFNLTVSHELHEITCCLKNSVDELANAELAISDLVSLLMVVLHIVAVYKTDLMPRSSKSTTV